jgi:hypothetical protein
VINGGLRTSFPIQVLPAPGPELAPACPGIITYGTDLWYYATSKETYSCNLRPLESSASSLTESLRNNILGIRGSAYFGAQPGRALVRPKYR